eukprot:scaffold50644_cov69-Phaeocystis_antarctica.AAC.1
MPQVTQLGPVVIVLVGRVGHRAALPRGDDPRHGGGGSLRAHLRPQGLELRACGGDALREARVGRAVDEQRLRGVGQGLALAPLLIKVSEAAVRPYGVEAIAHGHLGRHQACVPQLGRAVRRADRVGRRPAGLCGAALLGLREELAERAELHEGGGTRGIGRGEGGEAAGGGAAEGGRRARGEHGEHRGEGRRRHDHAAALALALAALLRRRRLATRRRLGLGLGLGLGTRQRGRGRGRRAAHEAAGGIRGGEGREG